MDGGAIIADVLVAHGVEFVFTLCGGHISPILVGAKQRGLRIVDVRHEVSAVFAADAVARLTGVPGVAAVTAGPGVTNTITAVKNAQMAQSPVLVFGGATPTLLKGRGSLQDIDQMTLIKPLVKYAGRVTRLRDLRGVVEKALSVARAGVPGPVFVEVPVDLLYGESLVREMYAKEIGGMKGLAGKALQTYVQWHLSRQFGRVPHRSGQVLHAAVPSASESAVAQAAARFAACERPVLVLGSQAMLDPEHVSELVASVEKLGMPTYLGGASRGLLGRESAIQFRHKRRDALKRADLVILAGFPCDFRLGYGNVIGGGAYLVNVNRDAGDTKKNRRPQLPVHGDPAGFLRALADRVESADGRWSAWFDELREREATREADIDAQAQQETEYINPLRLCQHLESVLPDDSLLVADGGDFVATAAYTVKPRGPLRWLDPGVFGTLGVGGGFAVGAAAARPSAQTWLLYGDGSCGYSVAEFDTFVRHGMPVIALVGTDASWAQIAREQVEMLEDDVGTVLLRTDYHRVAEGFGGVGFKIEREADVLEVLRAAQEAASAGKPVLINAQIGATNFRKGSISM